MGNQEVGKLYPKGRYILYLTGSCYKVTQQERGGIVARFVVYYTYCKSQHFDRQIAELGSSEVLLFLTKYTKWKRVLHSPVRSHMATPTLDGMIYLSPSYHQLPVLRHSSHGRLHYTQCSVSS